jgi:hypothetical protein
LISGDTATQRNRPQMTRLQKSPKPIRSSINPKNLPSKQSRFTLKKEVYPDEIIPFDEKDFKDF